MPANPSQYLYQSLHLQPSQCNDTIHGTMSVAALNHHHTMTTIYHPCHMEPQRLALALSLTAYNHNHHSLIMALVACVVGGILTLGGSLVLTVSTLWQGASQDGLGS